MDVCIYIHVCTNTYLCSINKQQPKEIDQIPKKNKKTVNYSLITSLHWAITQLLEQGRKP